MTRQNHEPSHRVQSHPSIEEMSEVYDAYWRHGVVTLEILIAELLVKNQDMRFNLQAIEQQRSRPEGYDINLSKNQSDSSLQTKLKWPQFARRRFTIVSDNGEHQHRTKLALRRCGRVERRQASVSPQNHSSTAYWY